jgi:hypothetical protein
MFGTAQELGPWSASLNATAVDVFSDPVDEVGEGQVGRMLSGRRERLLIGRRTMKARS